MRKLLNTLYVTNPDVFLSKDGDNVVAKIENSEVMRLPVINLEGIVCFNNLGASKYLMTMCAERNIGLCFLTSPWPILSSCDRWGQWQRIIATQTIQSGR